jgi:hypothetical protein
MIKWEWTQKSLNNKASYVSASFEDFWIIISACCPREDALLLRGADW